MKGNQQRLFDDIHEAFANERATDFSHPDLSFHETEEAGHGRHERRRYYVLPVTDQIRDRDRWQDLSAIGMAVSDRINPQGEEELEIRYDILSQLLEAKRFGKPFVVIGGSRTICIGSWMSPSTRMRTE